MADIFKPGLLPTTIFVTAAYFALITSFYFLIKWVPKIVVDMGHQPAARRESSSGSLLGAQRVVPCSGCWRRVTTFDRRPLLR